VPALQQWAAAEGDSFELTRVPKLPHPWDDEDGVPGPPVTIFVHPLRENKRPVGFAPWPEEEKRAKRRKKRKKRKK
jgi:hypothetical protein